MPNKCQIELNEKWVYDRLSDVTEKERAWIFLQEPGFIGFGVVQSTKIWWPPNIPATSPDWTLTSDLRLFGEKGEWHVWRDWDGKHYARLKKLEDINDTVTEYHALWGNEVKIEAPHWIKLVEERGIEIWLPLAKLKLTKGHLPLRLKLKQIIDYDPKYHLAGITDAVLIGLVTKSGKDLLLPTDMSVGS